MNTDKDNKVKYTKSVWTMVIFVSVGVIILCLCLIWFEINEAKESCININGTYKLDLYRGHFCNGKEFYKYHACKNFVCDSYWDFYFNKTLILDKIVD